MRSLPKRNNPLILPESSPSYEELLTLRRLGKTHLTVKATQVGTSNATKPENLGLFEYAHLRAPLPKDLRGSEIFPSSKTMQHPETYFLMRRSKDGFISATGMFKIAYPWAKSDEEKAEREYIKARSETSEDEIAGNVWISPFLALELAKEYQMFDWVRALLDSTEIIQSPAGSKKPITPPPKFDIPPSVESAEEPVPSTRTRSRRSASPTKFSSPKKNASPRKSRATRAAQDSSAAATNAASATLQAALNGSVENESVDESNDAATSEQPETAEKDEKDEKEAKDVKDAKPKKSSRSKKQAPAPTEVKVNAQPAAEIKDDVEVNVSVELPVSLSDLPPAENTEQMIAEAKKMVEEATKQEEDDTAAEASSSKKRKSDEVEEEEDKTQATGQPTKKARVLEDKLKKERVRNRALVGVTATLALA
ncbi:uncharacterized protein TRUGW13939_05601 [Talaromyces rugulosus]|uniref:Cell pattern formation-associated protein stuA n=1 Tax=Talaromyces rugulosus TaxID=121627 RepID=A0A7H8QX15_TALRU|nr:uncharacterized protein TRUGW13939_05601 [Talaromyces rugulosus]QKX58477.1 hypothetical protein TRUGW13939_05601 [Talaromyces rugulosus]